jgi:hypothetical protein
VALRIRSLHALISKRMDTKGYARERAYHGITDDETELHGVGTVGSFELDGQVEEEASRGGGGLP